MGVQRSFWLGSGLNGSLCKPVCAIRLVGVLLLSMALLVPPGRATDVELSPVRRTTIATADIDASLRFYRDLLGFTVEYDLEVTDPAQLRLFDPDATRGRVIALKRERLGGSIGLFWTPSFAPETCDPKARPGAVSILLLTKQLDALHDRLEAAGVSFVSSGSRYSQSRGDTRAFTALDPNCIRVAVAEIASESLEESLAK